MSGFPVVSYCDFSSFLLWLVKFKVRCWHTHFFECFFVLLSKGLYVSPGCSGTHYIDQAGLKHKERLLASESCDFFFLNNALDIHMNFRIH